MRRFGGGNRTEKKQTIIDKIKKFFEKYFGLGNSVNEDENIVYDITDDESSEYLDMVAEDGEKYKR